jgi:hypothetical protein
MRPRTQRHRQVALPVALLPLTAIMYRAWRLRHTTARAELGPGYGRKCEGECEGDCSSCRWAAAPRGPRIRTGTAAERGAGSGSFVQCSDCAWQRLPADAAVRARHRRAWRPGEYEGSEIEMWRTRSHPGLDAIGRQKGRGAMTRLPRSGDGRLGRLLAILLLGTVGGLAPGRAGGARPHHVWYPIHAPRLRLQPGHPQR